MSATFVFAGPTMEPQLIADILPEAYIHAPVSCGDILKILRLNPVRLIIIDGFYETCASVWHKEILLALHKGVEVIGAASMGALRAAELNHFGMIGIGQIYQWYRDGIIVDDDEVAILHLGEEYNYQPLSEALVNIRATLAKATVEGIINACEEQTIINHVKQSFYPHRSYQLSKNLFESDDSLQNLKNWLVDNTINLKQQDAIQALHWAKTHPPKSPLSFIFNDTIYLKRLTLSCNATAFAKNYPWLNSLECKTFTLNSDESLQSLFFVKKLANFLNLAYCFASVDPDFDQFSSQDFSDLSIKKVTDPELSMALAWLAQRKQQLPYTVEEIKQIAHINNLLFCDSKSYSISALYLFTSAFLIFDQLVNDAKINCKSQHIAQYRQALLHNLMLDTTSCLEDWLKSNAIDSALFELMIKKLARFRFSYNYFLGLFLAPIKHIPIKNWLSCAFEITRYW